MPGILFWRASLKAFLFGSFLIGVHVASRRRRNKPIPPFLDLLQLISSCRLIPRCNSKWCPSQTVNTDSWGRLYLWGHSILDCLSVFPSSASSMLCPTTSTSISLWIICFFLVRKHTATGHWLLHWIGGWLDTEVDASFMFEMSWKSFSKCSVESDPPLITVDCPEWLINITQQLNLDYQ